MSPTPHPVRRLLAVLAAATIGLFGAFLLSSPASAHSADVKGTAACSDSGWTVTWTIHNDWNAEATLDVTTTPSGGLSGLPSTLAARDSVTGHQSLAAGTNKVHIVVKAHWADGARHTSEATVGRPKGCDSKPCVKAADASYSHTFDGPGGTATVSLAKGQRLCGDTSQDFSLTSYTAHAAQWKGSFPQKLFDQATGTVSNEHPSVTLKVDVPDCFAQADLIWGGKDQILPGFDTGTPTYGNKVLGSKGAPGNGSKGPRGAWNGGDTECATASPSPSQPESASPSPSESSSAAAPVSTSPAAEGGLPVTGTSLTAFIVAAVVLIGGGAALFVIARRRRMSSGQ